MNSTIKAKDNLIPLPGVKVSAKKAKRSVWLKPGPLVAILLLSFVLYSFGLEIIKMQDNVDTMAKIQAQITSIEKQNIQLKKEIQRFQTNGYIEREAREKLGLVKPGEKVIIEVVPSKEVSP